MRHQRVVVGGAVLVVAAALCAAGLVVGPRLPAIVLTVLCCFPVAVVLHELAHAGTGLALRASVFRVTFTGLGRPRKLGLGRTVVVARPVPFGGLTLFTTTGRVQELLVIAAGPCLNLVLAGALLVLFPTVLEAHVFAFANLWLAVVNLVPFRTAQVASAARVPGGSDGWRLGGLLIGTKNGRQAQRRRWALARTYKEAGLAATVRSAVNAEMDGANSEAARFLAVARAQLRTQHPVLDLWLVTTLFQLPSRFDDAVRMKRSLDADGEAGGGDGDGETVVRADRLQREVAEIMARAKRGDAGGALAQLDALTARLPVGPEATDRLRPTLLVMQHDPEAVEQGLRLVAQSGRRARNGGKSRRPRKAKDPGLAGRVAFALVARHPFDERWAPAIEANLRVARKVHLARAAVADTKAIFRIRQGDAQRALRTAQRLLRSELRVDYRAHMHTTCALAYAVLGDANRAREELAQATAVDCYLPLVSEIEERLAALELTPTTS